MDKVTQVNAPVTRTALADDPLTQLHQHVLATERGPQFQRLFDRYAKEVWTLIQNNRRVATVWHRCCGPIWVRLALRAAHAPDVEVPAAVDDLSLQEGARRFAAALARYGSPELRRDLLALAPDIGRVSREACRFPSSSTIWAIECRRRHRPKPRRRDETQHT